MKKPGACTIPARKLYDYIKLLPDGDISIKLMDNHWVQIRAGRSNTKMVGMARANFPQVPEFPSVRPSQDPVATLAQHDRQDHLRHLQRGVALHPQRRAAGAQGRSRMAMVATDGHRLAHIEKHGRDPRRHLAARRRPSSRARRSPSCSRLLADVDPKDKEQSSSSPTTRTSSSSASAGRVLTRRKLTGQFPNYEAVLPARQQQVRHRPLAKT